MNAAADAESLLVAAVLETVSEPDRLRVLADIHDGRDQPEPHQLPEQVPDFAGMHIGELRDLVIGTSGSHRFRQLAVAEFEFRAGDAALAAVSFPVPRFRSRGAA